MTDKQTIAEQAKAEAAHHIRNAQDNLYRLHWGDGANHAEPRKPWSALSIEEKLERTREQVKNQAREHEALRRLISDVYWSVERLQKHSHGVTGEVLVPVTSETLRAHGCFGDRNNLPETDPSQVYF